MALPGRGCCGARRTLAEVAAELRASDSDAVVQEVKQPGIGAMLTPRSPLKWDRGYTGASAAPTLGENSLEIVSTLQRPNAPGT